MLLTQLAASCATRGFAQMDLFPPFSCPLFLLPHAMIRNRMNRHREKGKSQRLTHVNKTYKDARRCCGDT